MTDNWAQKGDVLHVKVWYSVKLYYYFEAFSFEEHELLHL